MRWILERPRLAIILKFCRYLNLCRYSPFFINDQMQLLNGIAIWVQDDIVPILADISDVAIQVCWVARRQARYSCYILRLGRQAVHVVILQYCFHSLSITFHIASVFHVPTCSVIRGANPAGFRLVIDFVFDFSHYSNHSLISSYLPRIVTPLPDLVPPGRVCRYFPNYFTTISTIHRCRSVCVSSISRYVPEISEGRRQ